jgi:hypothetical protein
MTDATIAFDFFGVTLRARAPNPIWIEKLQQGFSSFVVADSRPLVRPFEFTIHEADTPHVEHGLPQTTEGTQPDGFYGRAYENDHTIVLDVEGGGVTVVDHDARTAHSYLRPGSYRQFFGTAVMLVIDAALASGGQQLVHGASLIEQRSGRAVLIVVPSGGGKTTTSLALAHDGFALMTDDASVLIPGTNRPLVWGMPRALKVHRKTADLLPWVGPLEDKWDKNDEQGVSIAALAGRAAAAPMQPVELGAIMLLGPRNPERHRVEPASKSDLLIAMSHDNVSWRKAGMTPKALRRFEVFAQALAQVPAFRISASPELSSLPALVATAMQSAKA